MDAQNTSHDGEKWRSEVVGDLAVTETMSTPSSSGASSGSSKSAEQFEAFWRQLKEFHLNVLEELEAKVSKLKKERCLDAQRLEAFHDRNQQLKEQNKTLQDTVDLLEIRLRTQVCKRCAVLEEDLKKKQEQKLSLISKLKKEKDSLEDETSKLHSELRELKTSLSVLQQATSSDEHVIPGTPVLHSSLPAGGKLRRHRRPEHAKRVRYAETPLPWSGSLLFNGQPNTERVGAGEKSKRNEVLVPNTCVLDASEISADGDSDIENREEEVPETCGLLDKPRTKTLTVPGLSRGQSSSESPLMHNISLKPRPATGLCDLTTERSPSLLSHVKRFAQGGPARHAKRKKEEGEPESAGEQDRGLEDKRLHPEVHERSSSSSSRQQRGQVCATETFKTPGVRGVPAKAGGGGGGGGGGGEEGGERRQRSEAAWSVDPALALSEYDSEPDEEEWRHAEMPDSDCTWISHSVLQPRPERSPDEEENISGLGEKVNDSLDMMFDTTAYGEYKSFSRTQVERSQPRQEEWEDEEEEDEDEDAEGDGGNCDDNATSQRTERKAKYPNFAHVAVIRKKDERQKLQGTTCKECEACYSHLSDEEKQKKLSACSRHRFLYVPPCTPENFWEVGFPSTQTCIDRGYIKEDSNPLPRPRRRQPFNALFSPGKAPSEEPAKGKRPPLS
ncbi:DNA endonuclease RBBP8 [Nelusetta ayraudi]|uniref:DNA endonuclease RBBP8 n=1 Tax=Nelusetta ayraudi TaxID=303726 RepID=UPI003F72F795